MKMSSLLAATVLTAGLTVAGAAPAQAHSTDQDGSFLVGAHRGNVSEIAAASVALVRSQDTEVREIARGLAVDHWTMEATVVRVAHRHHVVLRNGLTGAQRVQLVALAQTPAAGFDTAWLKAQESAHLATLDLIHQEEQSGDAADVKELAGKAEPVVTEHLRMIRAALAP
jgi:putative membrane protein